MGCPSLGMHDDSLLGNQGDEPLIRRICPSLVMVEGFCRSALHVSWSEVKVLDGSTLLEMGIRP